VTGLDPYLLGAMVGQQLPFFSLIVPAWLILRLCRLARHGPDLARNPRLRSILCDPTVSDLEFH